MRPQDPPALGLSIGTTNIGAARPGNAPITRRSVLTLRDGRPAEVGVPAENPELTSAYPTRQGRVLGGFVERVGDPVPLVAPDGSSYRSEALLTAALEAMARAVDDGRPVTSVVVAVPAHWGPGAIGALRGALRGSPVLSPGGVPPTIVSDATAALAALQASPGLPGDGVVALCDFGGSGSSITLAGVDAGARGDLAPIGETIRFGDFSGDQIDQALLNHVLSGIRSAGEDETSGTAAVGPLTRLREQCRLAKERLSRETTAVVPAELPGHRSDVRITRTELDRLIAEPFAGFLDALGDVLERNRIPAASLAAVATVGGGAAIPGISQRLSEALRVPVITGPAPGLSAAAGAAILAARGGVPDAPTGIAAAAADAPTGLAPAAWAARAAGAAATESATDGSPSGTFRAVASSQGEGAAGEPVPYAGADYYNPGDYAAETGARPVVEFEPDGQPTVLVAPPLPWYRRPPLLFGTAAALAAVAVGGLAVTLTNSDSSPTTTTTRVTKPGESPATSAAPPPPVITTVTGSNGQATVTTLPATSTPGPTSGSPATTTTPTTMTTTTTTTTPTTTTTTTTTSTTTSTTTTSTTTPTTTPTTSTRTTTTTPTTEPPPTTTEPPPTTTAAPPTTTAEPVVSTTVAPAVTTQAVVPEEPAPTTKPAPPE